MQPERQSTRTLPVVFLSSVVVIAFFMVLNPPTAPEGVVAEAAEETPDVESRTEWPLIVEGFASVPTESEPPFRALRVLILRLGPDERYLPIGQVGRGALLEVVGRNDRGDWLAVSLTPGSRLYGWTPVNAVSTSQDLTILPIAPVKLLP